MGGKNVDQFQARKKAKEQKDAKTGTVSTATKTDSDKKQS
ncbi:Hypothetical protein LUCI_1421 [Lucifera butyrica]|uniref:Uncharacterized protein n=1 Tax=Lucifera butyrica TaxID=1351585 RepID=A0A498R517_9FIRM|nr:Hypothetical protein LUCI_1421 [Lucifera butyrica]